MDNLKLKGLPVEKLNEGFVAVILLGLLVWLLKKIIWDWVESGRVKKGEYLTIQAFETHRKECCVIGLKREFNDYKQESSTEQARTDNRLLTIEEKLREGQVTFQTLDRKMDEKFDHWSEKFDRLNETMTRIKTVIEIVLAEKDKKGD